MGRNEIILEEHIDLGHHKDIAIVSETKKRVKELMKRDKNETARTFSADLRRRIHADYPQILQRRAISS